MKHLFFFLLMLPFCAKAQQTGIPLSLSLSNNGTSLPGTGYAGIFSKTIHPGMTIGTYHVYRQRKRAEIFQTLKLGYFYHRHAQHAIQFYSELDYRHRIAGGFSGAALLGVGYLHSFADVQQFSWKDGRYVQKSNLGRPQFMASFSLAAGYDLRSRNLLPLRLFLQYQFWLQTPFVNKYVPLLPNTALHIGAICTLPIHHSNPAP